MIDLEKIDSTYPIEKILPFCKASRGDSRPAAQNMSPVGWEKNKSSFLYLLYVEKRYDGNGNGYIIYKKDDRIICGQGFYASEIDRMVCIGSRSYTVPGMNCFALHGDIKDFVHNIAKDNGMAGFFISMNEYNKRFVHGYNKINDPTNFKTSFRDETGQWWARKDRKISPTVPYDFPINLKNVKQWIIYHLWDFSYESQLKAKLKILRWID